MCLVFSIKHIYFLTSLFVFSTLGKVCKYIIVAICVSKLKFQIQSKSGGGGGAYDFKAHKFYPLMLGVIIHMLCLSIMIVWAYCIRGKLNAFLHFEEVRLLTIVCSRTVITQRMGTKMSSESVWNGTYIFVTLVKSEEHFSLQLLFVVEEYLTFYVKKQFYEPHYAMINLIFWL